jgi:hypothetical protein
MLVDVFSGPQRFRFNRLGENIIGKLSNDLTGQVADEIKPAEPLNYFIAQASATIEAGTPTLYSAARRKSRGRTILASFFRRGAMVASICCWVRLFDFMYLRILSPKAVFPLI